MKILLDILSANPPGGLPNITYEQAEAIYDLGLFLLRDDASDIGRFSYRGRKGHYYKGKHSPDHPSPYHHWIYGIGLMFFGQLLGTAITLKDMHDAVKE